MFFDLLEQFHDRPPGLVVRVVMVIEVIKVVRLVMVVEVVREVMVVKVVRVVMVVEVIRLLVEVVMVVRSQCWSQSIIINYNGFWV